MRLLGERGTAVWRPAKREIAEGVGAQRHHPARCRLSYHTAGGAGGAAPPLVGKARLRALHLPSVTPSLRAIHPASSPTAPSAVVNSPLFTTTVLYYFHE